MGNHVRHRIFPNFIYVICCDDPWAFFFQYYRRKSGKIRYESWHFMKISVHERPLDEVPIYLILSFASKFWHGNLIPTLINSSNSNSIERAHEILVTHPYTCTRFGWHSLTLAFTYKNSICVTYFVRKRGQLVYEVYEPCKHPIICIHLYYYMHHIPIYNIHHTK